MAPKARVRVKPRRHPNGELTDQPRLATPGQVRRIMRSAAIKAESPLLGTEIGRLLLNGFLSEAHAAASEKWMMQYSRYCRVCGSPPPNARSQDLGRIHGADNADVDEDLAERWRGDWAATEDYVGRAATEFLKQSVVENRVLATHEARLFMREALNKLAQRWKLA